MNANPAWDDDVPPFGNAKPESSIETAQAIDWPALEGQTPPLRDWAIEHWLGMGYATLLAGKGGIGKTLLAQTAASHLALGRKYIGEVTKPRKVLIWACEDDHDEMWRRQLRIAHHLGAPLSDFAENLIIVPRAGLENTLLSNSFGAPAWSPLIDELKEQINDLGVEVLIMDNVGQTCADEIGRHIVTKYINAFSGLRQGLATLLLAHPGKAAGSEYSGSTAWENAVRARWYLGDKLPDHPDNGAGDDPDSDIRYLYKRKTNYSAKDYVKLDYVDGVLLADASTPFEAIDSRFRADLAEKICLKAMAKLATMNKTPTDGKTSPDYLPKLIMEYGMQENMQSRDLASAMRSLMMAGKIIRVQVGTYHSRNPRFGLKLA